MRHSRRLLVVPAATAAILVLAAPVGAEEDYDDLRHAVRHTNHDYGSSVEEGDVLAALRRIGHDGGSSADDRDTAILRDYHRKLERVRRVALDQVGDRYRWGGEGPDSFDCSGLTRYVWRHAGVELPHSSRRQHDVTLRVARSDVRVGDLLFFRRPVGHVGIYVGDGRMVEAPERGERVRVVDAFSRSDLVKIGRPYDGRP
ncbi:MAG: C40 family peptidase [Nitriliruptorales bacterium]